MSVSDTIALANTFILFLTFLGLLWYAVETRKMRFATQASADAQSKTLTQLEKERIEALKPQVSVYFDVPPGEWIVFLVVKNFGQTPARLIQIHSDPPLRNWANPTIDEVAFVDTPLAWLAPGQEVRTALAITTSDFKRPGFQFRYSIQVDWYNTIDEDKQTMFGIHDLTSYRTQIPAHHNAICQIAEELNDMNRTLRDVVQERLTSKVVSLDVSHAEASVTKHRHAKARSKVVRPDDKS